MERPRNRRGQFVKSRAPHVADDKAFLIIELDRRTGHVETDDEFATPAEAFAMLYRAYEKYERKFNPETERDD